MYSLIRKRIFKLKEKNGIPFAGEHFGRGRKVAQSSVVVSDNDRRIVLGFDYLIDVTFANARQAHAQRQHTSTEQ